VRCYLLAIRRKFHKTVILHRIAAVFNLTQCPPGFVVSCPSLHVGGGGKKKNNYPLPKAVGVSNPSLSMLRLPHSGRMEFQSVVNSNSCDHVFPDRLAWGIPWLQICVDLVEPGEPLTSNHCRLQRDQSGDRNLPPRGERRPYFNGTAVKGNWGVT